MLALVLHAHLPYVRHPESDDHLEERWLFEALAEVYLPLLRVLEGLAARGVRYRITMSVSTTLLAMLEDDLLRARFARWLARLQRLCARLREERRPSDPLSPALAHAAAQLAAADETWRTIGANLPAALAALARAGYVELATTAATHAFLPGLASVPAALDAQVAVAVAEHGRVFGERPTSFWLPECAYLPALDEVLRRHGVDVTVVDAHSLTLARPRPPLGPHGPCVTPRGLAVVGRDPDTAARVWSAESGYPGHPDFRDYHHDAVDALPRAAVAEVLPPFAAHEDGPRVATGLKLWRVGDRTPGAPRSPYDPVAAAAAVRTCAEDFAARVRARIEAATRLGPDPVTIVAPYDAELFGHWWHEGPAFLGAVLERLGPLTVTLSEAVARAPRAPLVEPAPGTWGEGGDARTWVGVRTASWWPAIVRVARALPGLVRSHAAPSGAGQSDDALRARILSQACREALLSQSSDWLFLIHHGTAPEYATARLREHLTAFERLSAALVGGPSARLRALSAFTARESRARFCPHLDPALCAGTEATVPDRTGGVPGFSARASTELPR
jgi:1,4-alpha-glucan branching enzyme